MNKNLAGKTIKNARQLRHQQYDDEGFLLIEFTDGSSAVIVSTFNEKEWTGKSSGEYQTNIKILYNPDLKSLTECLFKLDLSLSTDAL